MWWVYIAKIYTYNLQRWVCGLKHYEKQVGNSSRLFGNMAMVMGQHQQKQKRKGRCFDVFVGGWYKGLWVQPLVTYW